MPVLDFIKAINKNSYLTLDDIRRYHTSGESDSRLINKIPFPTKNYTITYSTKNFRPNVLLNRIN